MNSIVSKRLRIEGVDVGGVDVDCRRRSVRRRSSTDRLRIRTGVQRRTIDRFNGFVASALVFEGSGWIQRRLEVFRQRFWLERAENGLERRRNRQERLPIADSPRTLASMVCTAPKGPRTAP
jgi:hypothetical protein